VAFVAHPDGSELWVEGEVTGTIILPDCYAAARVFIGVFDTQIVQRRPRAAAVQVVSSARSSHYLLAGVPEGRWFVHAVAVADSAEPQPWNQRGLLVGAPGPLRVAPGTTTIATVSLRPRQPADPPILLDLPDLDAANSWRPPACRRSE
jgi:hypothetical protein